MFRATLLVCCILSIGHAANITTKKYPGKDKFWFGVATASYQVEGAWNEDGKSENIWDRLCHSYPSVVANNNTGDIACDSYHKVDEDIALLKDLGVDHYRFSISWSRLLPQGSSNHINQKAVDYYNKLINGLKENNIEPLVTLFHWDTPQVVEDEGGFEGEFIIDLYADYARTCFQLFGDRVKYWLTFNEPKQTCNAGYGGGSFAPRKNSAGLGEYICVHNVVRAHAKAWHIYDDEFRKTQNGYVGITIDTGDFQPDNEDDPKSVDAAETLMQFTFGFYANPIFKGDYPDVMKTNIERRSIAQGLAKSRLPTFTDDEKAYIKGTHDYLGVNCYTSDLAKAASNPDPNAMGLYTDAEADQYQPDSWEKTPSDWLKVTPTACANVVRWVHKTYQPNKIIITENGLSDAGELEDNIRISFYTKYLSELRDVLDEGINLIGFTAWSFMDNFEWLQGYTQKFGLYSVDFNDPQRPRTAKKSVGWYKNLIKTRCLADECDS